MLSEIVNHRELRVTGLSRSGNHAILSWIQEQVSGRWCLLNCAEGRENPFDSARPMDDWKTYRTNDERFDLAAEQRGRFRPKDWLLISYEDTFLGRVCSEEYERNHDRWVGPSGRRQDVLILRDPFNLIASRIRYGEGFAGVPPRMAVRIWKHHARQFAGRPRALAFDPVLIMYNRWCASRPYRRAVAEQLGLRFTDAGHDRVPHCMGGSSFDRLAYDGRAGQMAVAERWRHFADDTGYWRLFDEQAVRLCRKIFGPLPAIDEWESRVGCSIDAGLFA